MSKTKVRIISLLLIFSVLSCGIFPTTAFADDLVEYYVEEAGMRISFPASYFILDRNMDRDDPLISALGLDYGTMLAYMESSHLYVEAFDLLSGHETVLIIVDLSGVADFSTIPDITVKTLASGLEKEYEKTGLTILDTEVYSHSQTKFIKFTCQSESEKLIQFYTVNNGKAINITTHAYDKNISAEEESLLNSITDSIVFDKVSDAPEPEETESTQYIDKKTGIRFTVPDNWLKEPLNKERKFIDVKYVSTDRESVFLYGSADLWSSLSESEREGKSREDVNFGFYSEMQMKLTMMLSGITVDNFETKTINSHSYYSFNGTGQQEMYGMNFSSPGTYYLTIYHGYFIMFQCFGDETGRHYEDFQQIMESVEFPEDISYTPPQSSDISVVDIPSVEQKEGFTERISDDRPVEGPSYNLTGTTLIISGVEEVYPRLYVDNWDDVSKTITKVIIDEGAKAIAPWAFQLCEELIEIQLPETITKIGKNAFSWCKKLEKIEVPDGVRMIEEGTFHHCESLESVILGDGIKTIGKDAFSRCKKLADFNMPKSVTEIGKSAFYMCESLPEIEITENVKYVGDGAFLGCPSAVISVSPKNQLFELVDGALISKADKRIIYFTPSYSGSYKLPDGVVIIGEDAFCLCHNLTEVIIPSGVKEIRYSAFSYCSKLKSVVIPASVDTIGEDAFNSTQLVLTVEKNSVAETYCKENSLSYKYSDDLMLTATESSGLKSDDDYFIIGATESTFEGLYKRMCINLDIKTHPVPTTGSKKGSSYGKEAYEQIVVLKDDNQTYEDIGYIYPANGEKEPKYIVRNWIGYHENGEKIQMKVFYMTDGKYVGNIRMDLTNSKSNSSSHSPYYIPSEGTHNLK